MLLPFLHTTGRSLFTSELLSLQMLSGVFGLQWELFLVGVCDRFDVLIHMGFRFVWF